MSTFPTRLPKNIYVTQVYRDGAGYALMIVYKYNVATGETHRKYEGAFDGWTLYTGNTPFTINENTVTFKSPIGVVRTIMFG